MERKYNKPNSCYTMKAILGGEMSSSKCLHQKTRENPQKQLNDVT